MAAWWRSHQEVQDAIESFGEKVQRDSEAKDLQKQKAEVESILKEHHNWLLHTLQEFKAPSATSKTALEKESFLLGGQTIVVRADLKPLALTASEKLGLDETQAYILVQRCVEEGQFTPTQAGAVDQVTAYYAAERLALLATVRTLLGFQASDNSSDASPISVLTDEAALLIEEGLEANLVGLVKANLCVKPGATLDSSDVAVWADRTAAELSLLLSTLFMLYFNHPPADSSRLLELGELFLDRIFLHDQSAADTWQSYTASDLSGVRHLATLVLLVLMGLDKLPIDGSDRQSSDYPLKTSAALTHFNALVFHFGDFSPALSLAWASSLQLLKAASVSGVSNLLADLPPESGEYHIQRAEEGGAFEQMLRMLQGEEFRGSEAHVTAYKFVLKLVVSTTLRAYNLIPPVLDESNPRGDLVTDLLTALFSGEEYLALDFFDDVTMTSLAEHLALLWPARAHVRFLRLMTSLCAGPWAAENVFNFLYLQRTICLAMPSSFQNSKPSETQIPIPLAPGLFVPPGLGYAVLNNDDVIDDVSLVAFDCRQHPILLLLLTSQSIAEILSRGSNGGFPQLSASLEFLAALVSAGGQTVTSLILDLENSPLVIAGKGDGRIDPSLHIDAVTSVASICHYLANSRGKGNDLLPATIGILAAFAELSPAKVAANVQQVVLFEAIDGKMERLQEVLANGEYKTGGASLTLAVLDLVHRLVDNGVQSEWAAALVRFCIVDLLPQLRGRRLQSQALLWQVVTRIVDIALAAAKSISFPTSSTSSVKAAIIETFLNPPSPEARNMLLSILAVGARGLEAIAYSEELEAAQKAIGRALRLFTLLLAHRQDEPSVNAFEALLFKEGNEAIIGAIASFLRYSGSTNVQVAALGAFRALLIRSAQVGGELATSIVKALGREEANRVQAALGEALEEGEGNSPGQIFTAVVELFVAASEWQPSFVAWVLLPATSGGEKNGTSETLATSGGGEKAENEKSVGLETLARWVMKLPDLVTSSPLDARMILLLLLCFFRSCGSEAAESAFGNKEQLSTALKETLQKASESVRSASENAETRKQDVESEQVIALVLSILSEQGWTVAKRRKLRTFAAQDGQTGSTKSEATDIVGQWEQIVGKRPSETVRWLCQSLVETRVFRDAVLASRAAIAGMLASPPPQANVALGEALQRARAALEAHPAFQQLLRDRVYASSREPASLILTDLAAHLTGLLSDRPIPSGPFFELATYTEDLSLESLLMLPFCTMTSSEDMVTSYEGPMTSSYDVAAAMNALGSDPAESVREAIEAVRKWNETEERAKAHLHFGRAFATLLGMVNVIKSPGDIWAPTELSASISHACSSLQTAATSASGSQSAAATSSLAAEHASVLASVLLSLVHASPPQIRRETAPLVVQTASILLQSNNELFSESSALKAVLQSTLLCLEVKPPKSTERNQEASLIQREDPATQESLSEAIPAFCAAFNHPEEQATVRAMISQLLFSKLPVDFWETRVIQNLPFSETVRALPTTPTEHLGGILSLLQGLVQRSREVAQRLVDAGFVQALVNLSRSHSPPFPNGPFSLSWDQTHANPSPVCGSVISLLAALNHQLGSKPSFRDRLESALAVIGPSILQTLNPPINGRPRVSLSSIRTALFSAQLLTSVSQPGLTLSTLLGPQFVQALNSAVVQLLSFIALEGSSRKSSLEVSVVLESKEDRILAATSANCVAESDRKGWFRISARSQSPRTPAQPQTPLLTLPLTPATVSEDPKGASLNLLGASAYTEALAGEVYKLAEALIRYEAIRICEAVQQIQRHVAGGAPPPQISSSEALHAIQDQCLSLLPSLAQLPSFADPLLALLDHAFLLDATTARLFGAHVSKLRTEIVAKHVKTALEALQKQGAASNETGDAVRMAAGQLLSKKALTT